MDGGGVGGSAGHPPAANGEAPFDREQLQQLETLARHMYSPETPVQQRQRATVALSGFTSNVEYIPQCQLLLDHSKDPYALLLAGASLLRLVGTYWNSFSPEQTLNIRNYLLNYLAAWCDKVPSFVLSSLMQVLMRISKLGWNANPAHRDICSQISKFLDHSPVHLVVGLQMLSELVSEMNTPVDGHSFTKHRKIAVSFRDHSLFRVFKLTLSTIDQINHKTLPGREDPKHLESVTRQALKVALQCLNFDYIGMNPDEASEDTGTIQIPSSWREVMETPSTLNVFFDLFNIADADWSALCLEILVQLSACRHSLFSNKEARLRFVERMCLGSTRILKVRHEALKDAECYHQFCRLLSRMKASYQLEDLLSTNNYEEWVRLVAMFTFESFKQWEWASQSVEYLVVLWSRVTMDIPYLRGDLPEFLGSFIPQINEAFIAARLDNVPKSLANGSLDGCSCPSAFRKCASVSVI